MSWKSTIILILSEKKFTHYLWELLMLFLAVFGGFLAENQRNHYVEHQREQQYMHSIIKDLEHDETNTDPLLINEFLMRAHFCKRNNWQTGLV